MDRNEINNLIKDAIKIAKQGDLTRAREMITVIVDEDPENEQALLAYAFIAPNKLEAEQVLEEVLRINPSNVTALKQLAKLRQAANSTGTGSAAPSPFTTAPENTPVFKETAFSAPVEEEPQYQSTTFQMGPSTTLTTPVGHTESCVQCGKPAASGSSYCAECQKEISNKQKNYETLSGGMDQMALEKKINELIEIQKEQQDELRKISRAAQLYFWLTIIGFVFSLIYICVMIFVFPSLLGGLSGLDFPTP